jgi:hypothetical protein
MDYRRIILDLASEDYVGLWEFEWRVNTVTPGLDVPIIRQALRAALTSLLEQNSLRFYKGVAFTGEEVELKPEDAHRVLSDDRQWEPVANGAEHIRVATTD